MPTYEQVINHEEKALPNTIRLVTSGQFYRAYNRSAWLFNTCLVNYKVIRKYIKTIQKDIRYVGFPISSIRNIVGERTMVPTEFGVDIVLNENEIPSEDAYLTWFDSVETHHSSQADILSIPLSGSEAEKEVLRRIKSFPIEQKSMLECVIFLAELRKLLNELQ